MLVCLFVFVVVFFLGGTILANSFVAALWRESKLAPVFRVRWLGRSHSSCPSTFAGLLEQFLTVRQSFDASISESPCARSRKLSSPQAKIPEQPRNMPAKPPAFMFRLWQR